MPTFLVDAQIRDFFCRLAEAEVIDLHWSSRVLDELARTLTEKLGLGPQKVARLVAALKHAFPGASVGGFTSLEQKLNLPDPNDRHVLAAAIQSESDLLVTANVKHFPETEVDIDARKPA